MATTTNFGWETPDDTDLVKDGAAAIRTALGGVDTSFVDLKGGTTGQVLSKASNTDLDFSWVAQDDSNAIQNAIVDAKGDLITATGADTPARLAVGTNGKFLSADSSTATGLAWASAPGPGWTQVATASFPAAATVTISSLSAANEFMVVLDGWSHNNGGSSAYMYVQFNSDTGTNYVRGNSANAVSNLYVTPQLGNTETGYGTFHVETAGTVQLKSVIASAGGAVGGVWKSASAVTSMTLGLSQTGSFDAGTYYVWSR